MIVSHGSGIGFGLFLVYFRVIVVGSDDSSDFQKSRRVSNKHDSPPHSVRLGVEAPAHHITSVPPLRLGRLGTSPRPTTPTFNYNLNNNYKSLRNAGHV
ncbi:hypothetical protein RUM43_007109 [Polyplax serrata]|uniref:Uncharacterized protein n=1 Tax=Polyplax serrata TaxID=468196 RepID=A0AAN8P852_POLSC